MADFKYVIVRAGDYEFPIIFPDKLVHEDMAAAVMRMDPIRKLDRDFPVHVVAAGFIDLEAVGVYEGRASESLGGVGPRPDDAALIEQFSVGHGINTGPPPAQFATSPRRGLPIPAPTPKPAPAPEKPSLLSRARGAKGRL